MDKFEERCADCVYLVVGENGESLCENSNYKENVKEIHDISFDECDPDDWGDDWEGGEEEDADPDS